MIQTSARTIQLSRFAVISEISSGLPQNSMLPQRVKLFLSDHVMLPAPWLREFVRWFARLGVPEGLAPKRGHQHQGSDLCKMIGRG